MSAAPVAFVVSTADGASGGEDEQDRSLLYTCAPGALSKPTVNTFKGLSLAVRGALDSICGEKTRVMRLLQHTHGQGELVVAFAHLQLCMIVLVLPGHVADGAAAGLVLHLSQSMVLLAGPSDSWLETERDAKGRLVHSQLTKLAKTLLDRLCDSMLHQLDGGALNRVLPALLFESGVMYTQLPAEKQLQLEAMLDVHQNVGLAGWGNSHTPLEGEEAGSNPFRFFKRNCCLMYRGTAVCSGLSPVHTKLIWQLCWGLSIFNQERVLPCQIITHKVYMGAPSSSSSSVDTGNQHMVAALAAVPMQPGQGPAANEAMHQSSLLVLVSACHLVLAVLLTTYDEELDIGVTGQLEGQAAVELLHKLHISYAADLDAASETSAFVHAACKPAVLDAALGSHLPSSFIKGSNPPGRSTNLFMRIVGKAIGTPRKQPQNQNSSGVGGDSGGNSFASPSRPIRWMGEHLAINSADGPSREGSAASTPVGKPLASPASTSPDYNSLHGLSPTGYTPTQGPQTPDTCLPLESPSKQPGTPVQTTPMLSPWSLTGKQGRLMSAAPSGKSARGKLNFGRLLLPSSPSATAAAAPHQSPLDPLPVVWRGGAASMPTGPSIISFDAGLGRVQVSGDVAHMSMVPEVWHAIGICRARFANSLVAVSAPPKHSRLCMTLDQIEQVSATRSQREGGQRMGSADPAPWQYHPEVAALAVILQVTVKLRLPPAIQASVPGPGSSWYCSACKRNDDSELFICHTADADEDKIISEWSTPWAFMPAS